MDLEALHVMSGSGDSTGSFFDDVAQMVRRRAQAQHPSVPGLHQGAPGLQGGLFGSLMRNLHHARLAQKRGVATPAQRRLLAHFRAMHARARQGHPRASLFMRTFKQAVERQAQARARGVRSAISGDAVRGGNFFVGADGFRPRIVSPGTPTGDVFIGSTEAGSRC